MASEILDGNFWRGWIRGGLTGDDRTLSGRAQRYTTIGELNNDRLRDERIAIEWEGFTDTQAASGGDHIPTEQWIQEQFTNRSIRLTKLALDSALADMRVQPAVRYRDNSPNSPLWFTNRPDVNRLPEEDTMERAFGSPHDLGSLIDYVEDVAKSSLTFRTGLGRRAPQSEIDDFNFRYSQAVIPASLTPQEVATLSMDEIESRQSALLLAEAAGGEIYIPGFYEASEEALRLNSRSALKNWISARIIDYISFEHGGTSVDASYGDLDVVMATVGNFFGSGVDIDYALRNEVDLLEKLVDNFQYMYYLYPIVGGLSTPELVAAVEGGLGRNVASSNAIWFSVTSAPPSQLRIDLTNLTNYIATFGELIFRIRVHEAILEFEDELEALVREGTETDVLDNEGRGYSDKVDALRRQRIEEIIEEEFGREGEEPPPEEDARLKRLAEQCFLIDHLPQLATRNQQRHVSSEAHGYNYFTALHGNTDTIVNKLIYNPALEVMDLLTPAELSSLVPKIRLYKIVYDVGEDGFGQSYEQEVPFEAHIQESEIQSMLQSSRERGQGAGIVSFDWSLEGANPFASRRFIDGNLKLFFQSMEAFLQRSVLPAVGVAEEGAEEVIKTFPFRYVDLVNTGMVERTPDLGWNPDYFKLKATVGWVPSNMDVFTGDPQIIEDKKRAIEQMRMSFFMTATEHNIDINDQGNLNLTVQYTAWQEISLADSDSDVLATLDTLRIRAARRAEVKKQLEEDPCDTEAFAQIESAYVAEVQDENYTAWQRLLKHLGERGNIFVLSVPEATLMERLRALDTTLRSTSGLTERLLGQLEAPEPVDFDLVRQENSSRRTSQMTRAISSRSRSEDETVLQRIQELTWRESGDRIQVQYFFFGDLIETALSLISHDVSSDDVNQLGSSLRGKFNKDMRTLLGPLTYIQSAQDASSGQREAFYNINLADVPISVHFFIEWFLKDVIGEQRTFYPAMEFIKNTTTTLVEPAVTQYCNDLTNVERQEFQIRTSFLSAAGIAAGDPIDSYKNVLNNRRVDVDKAYTAAQPPGGPGRLLWMPRPGERAYHYLLIYTMTAPSLGGLNGNFLDDKLKGIYHFGIGKNKGMLKSVKFSKTDFSLREARIERELLQNATGLAILANVYDITITMFGNTLFYPGSLIYLDPSGLGQIGLPTDPSSPARMLGIGGYHRVFEVKSYIESGKYETVIHAKWEASGETLPMTNRFQALAADNAAGCPGGRRGRSLLAILGEE